MKPDIHGGRSAKIAGEFGHAAGWPQGKLKSFRPPDRNNRVGLIFLRCWFLARDFSMAASNSRLLDG